VSYQTHFPHSANAYPSIIALAEAWIGQLLGPINESLQEIKTSVEELKTNMEELKASVKELTMDMKIIKVQTAKVWIPLLLPSITKRIYRLSISKRLMVK
jgi:hypothetical protein